MRKEHTVFYFNEEVDQALRECDEARAKELTRKYMEANAVIPDDGYADGGEPYTDEELETINS